MIDKITIIPKTRLDKRIGILNDDDVVRLNRALTAFLGRARTDSENSTVIIR